MLDILGLLGVAAVCVGLLYLASRIEPHWVAKDGSRFLATAQELDQWGLPTGRRHEVRVRVEEGTEFLHVSRRSFMRPTAAHWTISAKAPEAKKGRAVYYLKRADLDAPRQTRGAAAAGDLALRVPASSKIVPTLDAMVPGGDAAAEPTA